MSLKSRISIAVFVIFLAVIFLLLDRQTKDKIAFDKRSFKGRVVSSSKLEKGYYSINFINGDSTGKFSLSYKEGSPRAFTGDSIYKEADSKDIYVKSDDDSAFVKMKISNAH